MKPSIQLGLSKVSRLLAGQRYSKWALKRVIYAGLGRAARKDLHRIQRNHQCVGWSLDGPLRIAYLRTEFWLGAIQTGGAVAHTKGVIEAWERQGYKVSILSSFPLDYLELNGSARHILKPCVMAAPFGELREIEYNRPFVRHAKGILDQFKPHYIYQRYGHNSYAGAWLAAELQRPFVVEYNGSEVWMAKHWGTDLQFRSIAEEIEIANMQAADLIVANAEPLREQLVHRGICGEKIVVIPNGVDPEKYRPDIDGTGIRHKYQIPSDAIVVGFVGTYGPWHGTEILAQALAKLFRDHPKMHALFMGNGRHLPVVKSIVQGSGMAPRTIFTGELPHVEVPTYLAACDILVSPQVPNPDGSPFFGSPTKLFEYMAMGKAIVASNLDQIGQVLDHGTTAYLTLPGDISSLAQGIDALVKNPDWRNSLGTRARNEVVATYTWDRHVERMHEALRNRAKGVLI